MPLPSSQDVTCQNGRRGDTVQSRPRHTYRGIAQRHQPHTRSFRPNTGGCCCCCCCRYGVDNHALHTAGGTSGPTKPNQTKHHIGIQHHMRSSREIDHPTICPPASRSTSRSTRDLERTSRAKFGLQPLPTQLKRTPMLQKDVTQRTGQHVACRNRGDGRSRNQSYGTCCLHGGYIKGKKRRNGEQYQCFTTSIARLDSCVCCMYHTLVPKKEMLPP